MTFAPTPSESHHASLSFPVDTATIAVSTPGTTPTDMFASGPGYVVVELDSDGGYTLTPTADGWTIGTNNAAVNHGRIGSVTTQGVLTIGAPENMSDPARTVRVPCRGRVDVSVTSDGTIHLVRSHG
jgi:hypothetical protein